MAEADFGCSESRIKVHMSSEARMLVARCCALLSLGVVAISLVGILGHDKIWASWLEDGVPMALSTAAALLFSGIAIILITYERTGHGKDREEA